MKHREVKVIGLGGVGTALLPVLCRMLAHSEGTTTLTFIDGDEYKPENADRQSFRKFGPKAAVKAGELAPAFSQISIRPIEKYVTQENIEGLIGEGDIIFLCVDNHKTRKLVSDHCKTLKDATLISGGNDEIDGNVQVYLRRDGKDITHPLDKGHPEIANPKDKSPDEQGCEAALREGNKQLLIANDGVAYAMRLNFWRIENGLFEEFGETYITPGKGLIQTMSRLVRPSNQ